MQPDPRSRSACLLLLFSCLIAPLAGCANQVHWNGYLFDPVHQDARRAGLPTMVYLRSWYLPECTEFENEALKDPEVIAATRGYRCANVDYDWNKAKAEEWGVRRAPAIVLLDPDGKVLSMLQGQISAEALRTTLAINNQPPTTQSTSVPAQPPN